MFFSSFIQTTKAPLPRFFWNPNKNKGWSQRRRSFQKVRLKQVTHLECWQPSEMLPFCCFSSSSSTVSQHQRFGFCLYCAMLLPPLQVDGYWTLQSCNSETTLERASLAVSLLPKWKTITIVDKKKPTTTTFVIYNHKILLCLYGLKCVLLCPTAVHAGEYNGQKVAVKIIKCDVRAQAFLQETTVMTWVWRSSTLWSSLQDKF